MGGRAFRRMEQCEVEAMKEGKAWCSPVADRGQGKVGEHLEAGRQRHGSPKGVSAARRTDQCLGTKEGRVQESDREDWGSDEGVADAGSKK